MLTLIGIIYQLAVAVGALALWVFLCRRFFQVDRQPDSAHFFATDDGWQLALCRFVGRGDGSAVHSGERRLPVLLCPGMGMSGALFEQGSSPLAPYLAERGHDVWTLDPRGSGFASRPRLWGSHQARWRFDEYVELDLPRAVAEVCRRSCSDGVHLVGFGLGGAAALCLLGGRAPEAERVRSFIGLATTAHYGRQARDVAPRLLRLLGWLPARALIRIVSPLLGRVALWPLSLLHDRDNTDGAVLRRTLVNAFDGLSRREVAQLARWVDDDVFDSADGGKDFRERLDAIATPTLLVFGPHDRLCPPTTVQQTFDLLGVEHKELLFAGRAGGMSANYGHLDLLIGRTAVRDVFPRLLHWLDHGTGLCSGDERARAAEEDRPDGSGAVPRSGSHGRGAGGGATREGEDDGDRAEDDDRDDEQLLGTDPLDIAIGDVPNIPNIPRRD